MNKDQTVLLIKEAMLNAGLDEEEAQRVADSSQASADAIRRFEVIEDDLTTLAAAYNKSKNVIKVLGGLVLTNFAGDIYEWLQVI